MTAQLSPLRDGRITASRVGAILGVNKYQTADDVLRDMVRAHHDAEPEFTGNEATEWGNAHEEDARTEYEQARGVLVESAQEFIIHPEHDWLGVSPDGLVGDDGMTEFKAPYRARYTTLYEKPEYDAQVQLQLACTGRDWCDFVIWRSFDQANRLGIDPLIIERVPTDREWLPSRLLVLSEFHQRYLTIIGDEALAAPFLAPLERSDDTWAHAAAEFHAAGEVARAADARLDAAKARLRELAGGHSAKGCGVQVIRSERAGTVEYSKALAKFAPDADLSEFRKSPSVVWTVKDSA